MPVIIETNSTPAVQSARDVDSGSCECVDDEMIVLAGDDTPILLPGSHLPTFADNGWGEIPDDDYPAADSDPADPFADDLDSACYMASETIAEPIDDQTPNRIEHAPKTVKVRIPDSGWVKLVNAVKPTAKTGCDWDGPSLGTGKLVDLAPGCLIVRGGGDDDPVEMGAVGPNGSIDWWTSTTVQYEWAIRLKPYAIAYLAHGETRLEAVDMGRKAAAIRKAIALAASAHNKAIEDAKYQDREASRHATDKDLAKAAAAETARAEARAIVDAIKSDIARDKAAIAEIDARATALAFGKTG